MSSTAGGLRMRAPAKINMGLEVIRRRDDGYHDINTIFIPLDLYDEILLRPLDDGRITLHIEGNDKLDAGPGNLCVRAATALRERLGREDLGLEIVLIKRIPMGAGLGGGSSDAAAVLLGAARLWGESAADSPLLHDIAISVGSDVPFFLKRGAAEAGSRGELLHELDIVIPYSILLVNPGIHVPTPWAYRMVGRTGERVGSDLPAMMREGLRLPNQLRTSIVNDFEPAIFAAHPSLADIKERLYDAGALFALMSGSGSTMFGIFPDDETATATANHFKEYWNVVAHQSAGVSSTPF